MPCPRPPCTAHDPSRAPFPLLAKAGEAAGRVGAVREECPYRDDDARSVPWLDGWWQGRRARERSAVRMARDERRWRPARVTEKKEPPALVGECRWPGCGEAIPRDPARTALQNARTHYCEAHKVEMRRLRRRERTDRERAEIAAGTRAPRAGGTAFRGPRADKAKAEAARVNAYWAALGYDVKAEVVLDEPVREPSGKTRRVSRVKSDLVGGVPPGVSWAEVEERMRRRDKAAGHGTSGW